MQWVLVEELGQDRHGSPKGHRSTLGPLSMGTNGGPVLATVVPLLNEAEHVGHLLYSLVRQTMNASDHTVLLLDGGSTDGTLEVIRHILEGLNEHAPAVQLIHNPQRTVAHARNLALEHLPDSVKYVVELLGHAAIADDHLEQRMRAWDLAEQLAEQPLAGVGCRVEGLNERTSRTAMWVDAALSSPFGQSDGQFSSFNRVEPTQVPAFVTHRRSALEAVGGWDPAFLTSQDSELSMRLLDNGFALYRAPFPTVKMARRETLTKWWKMGHRYGFWRTKVVVKHPRRFRVVEWLPWVGVIGTLVAWFAQVNLWWIGVAAYAVVLALEGARASFNRPSLLLGLPITLLILHVSFSIGLVDGFFRRGRNASDR